MHQRTLIKEHYAFSLVCVCVCVHVRVESRLQLYLTNLVFLFIRGKTISCSGSTIAKVEAKRVIVVNRNLTLCSWVCAGALVGI